MPAATAAPDPPDEPPGVWAVRQGLRAAPQSSGSVTPFAPNSGVFVLPNITSPASRKRCVTRACRSATSSARARDPHEVGKPAYSWPRSFTRNGTPAKGPDRDGSAARASATSGNGMTTALSVGLTASDRCTGQAEQLAGGDLPGGDESGQRGGVGGEVLAEVHRRSLGGPASGPPGDRPRRPLRSPHGQGPRAQPRRRPPDRRARPAAGQGPSVRSRSRRCAISRSCSSTRPVRSRRAPTWCCGAGWARRTRRRTCATPIDEQALVDFRGMLMPAADMALHRAEMDGFRDGVDLGEWQQGRYEWVLANNDFRRDVLESAARRRAAAAQRDPRHLPGALVVVGVERQPQRHDDARLPGAARRGRGRRGTGQGQALRPRVAGLPRRPAVPPGRRRSGSATSAGSARWASRGPRGPGAARSSRSTSARPASRPWSRGSAGAWRVDPAQLGQPFAGRAALLSPFDRLHHDRKRMAELFEFDYNLEMFKPAAKRRWGYYALPILYGDRLVGKLDAKAERDAGVLRVAAVHRDVEFTKTMAAAVDREIADLAHWLDLAGSCVGMPRVRRHRGSACSGHRCVAGLGAGDCGVHTGWSLPREAAVHATAVRPGCGARVTPRGRRPHGHVLGDRLLRRASGSTAAGRPGSGCPGRP